MIPEHISYSSWILFRQVCQWRWKLDYIEKRHLSTYSIHFDFGGAVHFAIECMKRRKHTISLEHSHKIFEKKLRLRYKENSSKYDAPADLEEFVKAGHNILEHLHECKELTDAEVLYNEYRLFDDIDRTDDVKIKFKGFIDIVIKTKDARGNSILYVCDFKTCSWGWPKEKREDKNLHFQILLYKHFLCKKFNLDPKMVRTAFILLKKKPGKNAPVIEFFPISAGPVSVQRALDALNSDITKMSMHEKDGDFQKNRESCKDKYGRTCPYFGSEYCPGVKASK